MDPPAPAPALGRLSLFPREVRDEVYRHVFCARYLAPRPGVIHHCMDNYAGRRIRSTSRYGGFVCANIGIFKTSRVLREESAEIFYRECVFKFSTSRILEDESDLALLQVAYDRYPITKKEEALRLLRQSWQRPIFGIDVPSAMNMWNIEIDLRDYGMSKYGPGKVHLLAAITSHLSTIFGSSQPLRKSCRVVIDEDFIQSGRLVYPCSLRKAFKIWMEFLKTLVGYKILMVVFTTVGPQRCEWLRSINGDAMFFHARISPFLSLVRENLETVLGPSTMVDNFHYNTFLRSFEFHPHAHLQRL